MEYQTILGEDDPPPRYVPREDVDNSNSSSILVVQPGTFEFTIPFHRDHGIDQSTSLSEDFDPFKRSHASQLRASMISCLWPYNGSRALGSEVGMGDTSLSGTLLSSEYFHEQYSNSETQTKTTLLDEISLRLQAKHSSPSAPDINDALWLKTSIRSLFDTTSPRSSFLDELNTRHPNVHFEGTSFTDSTHEILSSVMVSSGINAQIIFMKDVELTNLIPFDSSGIRAWIIDLSGEIPSSVNEATKALSKDEASCLLVLLEFVLHCECGILLRQHRRKALRLIQKIAAEHHTLPPTLELKGVEPAKHPFGGGGYSDVYKASWHGTSICVKRLRIYLDPESGSAGARKDKVLQAFLKEALIWKQLRHPNILPFLGISSTCFPHQMSLISPYMANGDIMSYLETVSGTNAPTYTQRLGWLLGVARGMQYIHSMSLYHGDIKGANILIDDNDVARLADLGISSVAWSATETLGWETSTAGGFKGSLRWMSPEVVMNSSPARTTARDVYAFGSTILEVVSGCSPWSDVREDTKVILNLSQGKHPDRPDGFGNDVWSIVESCWALKPLERPSAAAIFERCRISLSVLRRTPSPMNSRDGSINNSLSESDSAPQGCSIDHEMLPTPSINAIARSSAAFDRLQNLYHEVLRSLDTETTDSVEDSDDVDSNDRDAMAQIPTTQAESARQPTQSSPMSTPPFPPMIHRKALRRTPAQNGESKRLAMSRNRPPLPYKPAPLSSNRHHQWASAGQIQDTLLDPLELGTLAPGSSSQSLATKDQKEPVESMSQTEMSRQTHIRKIISQEEAYIEDLNIVEQRFINPLLQSQGVIPPDQLQAFVDVVFSNILDLRECSKLLVKNIYQRQREQNGVIQWIGDVFMAAAIELSPAYPNYIGNHLAAEKRLKEELEDNLDFKMWLEAQSRRPKPASASDARRKLDLKHLLNRPSEHLQSYPVLLNVIHHETERGNPDCDFLVTAIEAVHSLNGVAQLRTFQMAMGRGDPRKWEWHDLVGPTVREKMTKDEMKRQAIIFELIKVEMVYVKDLENIGVMYIQPLLQADPPIIPQPRLNQFIASVFNNYADLHQHHLRLLDRLHHIQREQHPVIQSVSAAMLDAVLHFREAYLEYITNYPIAAWKIDNEMKNNSDFKAFVDQCVRHPSAHRLDMRNFINRPTPRLLHYEVFLKSIYEATPPGHSDTIEIPEIVDLLNLLRKETEPGVASAKQKVELWKFSEGLMFKPGESFDMELLDESRSLIFTGKVMRQSERSLGRNSWSELFVLLFDNYFVMTKLKEGDGVMNYQVSRRPIPLDLLTIISFNDPPTQRSAGLLQNLRGGSDTTSWSSPFGSYAPSPEFSSIFPSNTTSESRLVYPFTLHQSGRAGGIHVLFAESAAAREEWKQKLEEAFGLRKVIQESNNVFELMTLSIDTFSSPSMINGIGIKNGLMKQQSYMENYTGRVTCSVPFDMADGRGLVAIGCAEGVWIGFRHDPKSMRRVLHLRMVTQCAMLHDFVIFLVLADKSLFAYHIEALVPSTPHAPQASAVPQKLNGNKNVQFFSVGNVQGRTLVIYMIKKGSDSNFRVLEPVGDKINERLRQPAGFGSKLGFKTAKSEWFRIYREFFSPSESFDLIFLKAKIVILCTKGFEIMDLYDFKSVTIPQREDPRLAYLSKRFEQCRPIAMYRSTEDEFLLCYDEFGLYVNAHGDPSRSTDGVIEWEGRAERAAQHNHFILLFNSQFIEIRSLKTGRLVQIIPGTEISCTWDGRGVDDPVAQNLLFQSSGGEIDEAQDTKIHIVMNTPDVRASEMGRTNGVSSSVVTQVVAELSLTLPLVHQAGNDNAV